MEKRLDCLDYILEVADTAIYLGVSLHEHCAGRLQERRVESRLPMQFGIAHDLVDVSDSASPANITGEARQPSSVCHVYRLCSKSTASPRMQPECEMPSGPPDVVTAVES